MTLPNLISVQRIGFTRSQGRCPSPFLVRGLVPMLTCAGIHARRGRQSGRSSSSHFDATFPRVEEGRWPALHHYLGPRKVFSLVVLRDHPRDRQREKERKRGKEKRKTETKGRREREKEREREQQGEKEKENEEEHQNIREGRETDMVDQVSVKALASLFIFALLRTRPASISRMFGPPDAPEELYLLAAREDGTAYYSDVPLTESPTANLILHHSTRLSCAVRC